MLDAADGELNSKNAVFIVCFDQENAFSWGRAKLIKYSYSLMEKYEERNVFCKKRISQSMSMQSETIVYVILVSRVLAQLFTISNCFYINYLGLPCFIVYTKIDNFAMFMHFSVICLFTKIKLKTSLYLSWAPCTYIILHTNRKLISMQSYKLRQQNYCIEGEKFYSYLTWESCDVLSSPMMMRCSTYPLEIFLGWEGKLTKIL